MLHESNVAFRNHRHISKKKAHSALKQNLLNFINDLKIIVNNLNIVLLNQRHDYFITIKKIKIRFFMRFNIFAFRNITAHVTSYALNKILDEYKRLTD